MHTPTRLIVPLTHLDRPLAAQAADAAAAGADLLELRVDLIQDADAVAAFLRAGPPKPCILTIRHASEGGGWDADDAERVALYERLGLLSPGYIDVELSTWQRSSNLRQKLDLVCRRRGAADSGGRARNELILSVHDFRSADNAKAQWAALCDSPATVRKLAATPRSAAEAIELLRLPGVSGDDAGALVVGMGEAGLLTRVLGRAVGMWGTFAALDEQSASAPGQITSERLRSEFRWAEIDAQTPVFAVIGWPVAHSLSPRLHNAAMAAAGIAGVYVHAPTPPTEGDFESLMRAVKASAIRFAGFSVTIPHKEHAYRWLKKSGVGVSTWAERCGAVNTLVRTREGWRGENSDGTGAVYALGHHPVFRRGSWLGRPVSVLGAGGAARAIVPALRELGCEVTIYNRSFERAEALARACHAAAAPWGARTAHRGALLVNCTPVGLPPAVEESPFPAEAHRPDCVVFDTIYRPRETRLLRDAAAAGAPTLSGIEMFIAQAAEQFRCWHGREMDRVRAAELLASIS